MKKNDFIKSLVEYTEKEWTGKKGYWTNDDSFKYCKFIYTGNFWKKTISKKVA